MTEEQADRLMNYRRYGQEDLNNCIKCFLFKISGGTKFPQEKKRNLKEKNFFYSKGYSTQTSKQTKKNGKKDHKTNLLFEIFFLAYSKFTSNSVSDFDQFLHTPSAICDADDFPENCQKTRATSVFKKIYPDSSILQVTPFTFLFTNLFQIMHHFYLINGLFGLIISLMLQRFT